MNSGKKNKQKLAENRTAGFFKKNWASIVSIAISIIAVLISIQSNMYIRKTSNSDVLIEDVSELYNRDYETWFISIYACDDDYSDGKIVRLNTDAEFWLSNTGGLDTTLLAADFRSDISIPDTRFGSNQENMWTTTIYEHPNPHIYGDEILSLELPAGKGTPINIVAENSAYFITTDEAITYYKSLILPGGHQEPLNKRGTWIFRFSDGKAYSKTYTQADFGDIISLESLDKDLKNLFELSCKEVEGKL